MARALYHPEHGYYARGLDRVGRSGDFFTSVSAGPLFGRLLARHLAAAWRELGSPPRWRILEVGAHDGRLAEDMLDGLASHEPTACTGLEYAIVEPLPALAAAQRRRLERFATPLRQVAAPEELDPAPGLLVANELLDALPFHLVESDGAGWRELGVGLDESGRFHLRDLGPAGAIAARLPLRPAGYRSEVRPDFARFLAPYARLLAPGRMLWIDYGFERDDYYAPERDQGTLRTFSRHRAGDDPLADPGERDITAHVDFTALHEAVDALGGRVVRFENQARFLTAAARPWLLSLEGRSDPDTRKLLRNFQTLTHPGQLGSRFHVLEAAFPAS